MDDRLGQLIGRARERFPEAVSEPFEALGEVSIDVARDRLGEVAGWLRDEGPFELLADLSGVDFWGVNESPRRFLVALHLLSLATGMRLRLRVWVPEGDERCPSVTAVWPTANWHEREAYDFFGIVFEGHPDLRRIEMPEDWDGFPQRKDYPLGGVNVRYWNANVPPPDRRGQPTGETTTGYPGRTS